MQTCSRRRQNAGTVIGAAVVGAALTLTTAALGPSATASSVTASPTAGHSTGKGGRTVLVTAGPHGALGNGPSSGTVSADGRYVVFASLADNLVANDTNGKQDVFIRDLHSEVTRVVSLAHDGGLANGNSSSPSISADGRYVAFASGASDLVGSATVHYSDIFVRDLVKNVTIQVSQGLSGRADSGGGASPSISADGSRIAFVSSATDLVADDTNDAEDVFVWDRRTRTTIRVSVGPGGIQSRPTTPDQDPYGALRSSYDPHISGNGKVVAFTSTALNLVPGDTNAASDIFVHDLDQKTTTRVSVATGGAQSTMGYKGIGSEAASISANGDVVTFVAYAHGLATPSRDNAIDSYVHFVRANRTELVQKIDPGAARSYGAYAAQISPDGRYIAFSSPDDNVVPGDTNGIGDVFVRDLKKGTITLASGSTNGAPANGESDQPSISAGGRVVAFHSTASNLTPGGGSGELNELYARRVH